MKQPQNFKPSTRKTVSGGLELENPRWTILAIVAALAIDPLLFQLFLSSGLGLDVAHVTSFAAAFAIIHFFIARPAFAHALENREQTSPWLPGQFGLVGLLALFLRGGVLSLLVRTWGWAPQLAIIPAAVIGSF